MIQDIVPAVFNNHYEPQQPDAGSYLISVKDGRLLIRYDADSKSISFPVCSDFPDITGTVYLFSVNSDRYFLFPAPESVPDGCAWYMLKNLRALEQQDNLGMFIAYTAWHLASWYETSRYCGRCGAKTEHDTVERAMACPKCGSKIYPRINPAVIVGVCNGDKLLLTRYKVGFAFNAMIAGFTEIGETMEETVQREVMEEVGLKVKNIRYYKSQPWGIASDILMGYYCDVDSDDTIHRDDSELKYAEWVQREEIELQPDDLSLTNEMMKMFKEGRDRECA